MLGDAASRNMAIGMDTASSANTLTLANGMVITKASFYICYVHISFCFTISVSYVPFFQSLQYHASTCLKMKYIAQHLQVNMSSYSLIFTLNKQDKLYSQFNY